MSMPTSSTVIAHIKKSGVVPADLVSMDVLNFTGNIWLWLHLHFISEELIK